MTSSEILELLDCIAAEPSVNMKVELLKEFSDESVFRSVLELTYNSLRRYNMLQVPYATIGTGDFNDNTWTLFSALAGGWVSGDAAKASVSRELSRLNQPSQELFKRILNKDLRAGFNAKLINKAIKGFIKIEPYMRCSLPKHVKMEELEWPMFSQLKLDGMFITITHTGCTRIASRQGQVFPDAVFPQLRKEVVASIPKGTQLQGEVVFKKDGKLLPRTVSNGLANTALKLGKMPDDAEPVYFVWDLVSLTEIQESNSPPYKRRFEYLKDCILNCSMIVPVESIVVNSLEEATAHFDAVIARKEEGTILKSFNNIWKSGTSKTQIKLKGEASCELQVVGKLDGKGKYEGFIGSLECVSSCKRLRVFVSGFTDEMRTRITRDFETEILGSIIETKHNGVTKSKVKNEWSLTHPRIVEFRLDKDVADDLSEIDPSGGFTSSVKSVGEDFYEL